MSFPRSSPNISLLQNLLIYRLFMRNVTVQWSYAVGSHTPVAIQHAYGEAQIYMLIAGTTVWAVSLVAVLMWRDIRVIGIKQTKGNVF